jgi:hypothetical protein
MIWVEVVCDSCSAQDEGTSLGRRPVRRALLNAAKARGWLIQRGRHPCPTCRHGAETGHTVHPSLRWCETCDRDIRPSRPAEHCTDTQQEVDG